MLVCFPGFTQSVELLIIIENNPFRIQARWGIKARALIEIIRLHWPELAQESQNLSAFLIRGLLDEMQSIVGVFLLQSVVFDAYGIACEIMPGHIFFFVRHKGPG